jgi:predicted TIM-barrel fold metal-dependent hydrolase
LPSRSTTGIAPLGDLTTTEGVRLPTLKDKLFDLREIHIKEMDEPGIDFQIIFHGVPPAQNLTGDEAVTLTERVNDRLAAAIAKHPRRFGGFAALPTSNPATAADERDRAVSELGFKGAMIHGAANEASLAIRLILSGVSDKYFNLKIVLAISARRCRLVWRID